MPVLSLPAPDLPSAAHCARVAAWIRARIAAAGGRIDFAEYLHLALYAPGLGYYVAGLHKFGAGGDFVTAPLLGDLFGRCLARQCAEVLGRLGGGDVLEVGAGDGTLMVQVLAELEQLGALPQRYQVLELSPDLRARQRHTLHARLGHLASRVEWLDRLPPAGLRGVVIANEVLDAMPVSLCRLEAAGPQAVGVANGTDGFIWRDAPRGLALPASLAARRAGLPDGYLTETHEQAGAWVRTLGERLAAGVLLIIDYGFPAHEYYHPDRAAGTVMCHYRHLSHADPLCYPGIQDVTAHLNFSELAWAAEAAGLAVLGYTQQAPFLLSLGLLDRLREADTGDAALNLGLTSQVKRLTLASEMGELFKVLALGRGIDGPLTGFAMHDHADRL